MLAKSENKLETLSKPPCSSNSSQIENTFSFNTNWQNHAQNNTNTGNDPFMPMNSTACNRLIFAGLEQDYHNEQVLQCSTNVFKDEPYSSNQDMHVHHVSSLDDNRWFHHEGYLVEAETADDEDLDDCILMAFNNDSNQIRGFKENMIQPDFQKSSNSSRLLLNPNGLASGSILQNRTKNKFVE